MADTLTDDEIMALNANEVFFSETPTRFPEAGHGTQYHAGAPGVIAFARAVLAAAVPQWLPIETAPKGKTLLVHYKNQLGNGRTMRATYYLADSLESDEADSGYADEGWYEESEAYEYLMPLEHEPTHWMPLPPPPERTP